MAVRVSLDALAQSIPTLRAAGVTELVCGDVTIAEPHDERPTEPAPPPTERDFPPEEPASDRVARELGYLFIESPGESPEVEEMLCASWRGEEPR